MHNPILLSVSVQREANPVEVLLLQIFLTISLYSVAPSENSATKGSTGISEQHIGLIPKSEIIKRYGMLHVATVACAPRLAGTVLNVATAAMKAIDSLMSLTYQNTFTFAPPRFSQIHSHSVSGAIRYFVEVFKTSCVRQQYQCSKHWLARLSISFLSSPGFTELYPTKIIYLSCICFITVLSKII